MKLIYWNTKNSSTIDHIIDLSNDFNPDFLFLSETDEQLIVKNHSTLSSCNYEHFPNPGCSRLIIIKRKDISCDLNLQTNYFTTIHVPDQNIYLISVHLPSQMFNHFDSLKNFIRRMRHEIDSKIGKSHESNILIIGDFNVNPFESPMIDFDGFSATNTKKFRNKVSSYGDEKILYYNPTWQLYSENNFPGTKYFARPSASSFDIIEHHFLDQVLLSKKLLTSLIHEEISLIQNSNKFSFFDFAKNEILISDHLPLKYEITYKT